MDLIQALVLGIVQGLTEFIPVSSSAHLVLAPWVLGWPDPGLAFDTVLHLGTLVGLLVYFWRDIPPLIAAFFSSLLRRGAWNARSGGRLAEPYSRVAWAIVIGSLPAGAIGLAFQDFFERLFSSEFAVGIFLLITALILVVSERLGRRVRAIEQITWLDALLIGVAQAAAIAPGLSRSGATIAAGLGRGLRRDDAARFSFLLSIPAIAAAGFLQLLDLVRDGRFSAELPLMAAGFFTAALSGYLCIRFLLSFLRRGRLYVFAGYCALVGGAVLLVSALG
ncbi:MAG: undecaprenyl-diphosphate phosphatase [Chloroflexi bacterium]|nr:undecaprenyl-diphosphate phosphatase [Chloroflexota bacterium]